MYQNPFLCLEEVNGIADRGEARLCFILCKNSINLEEDASHIKYYKVTYYKICGNESFIFLCQVLNQRDKSSKIISHLLSQLNFVMYKKLYIVFSR